MAEDHKWPPPEAVPPEEEVGSLIAFLYRQAFHRPFHDACNEGVAKNRENNPYVLATWKLPKPVADLIRDGHEPALSNSPEDKDKAEMLVQHLLIKYLAPEILGIPDKIW